MHKLYSVLMTVIYLQFSSQRSVIPAFFRVSVLYRSDSTVFFLAMQEVAVQEALFQDLSWHCRRCWNQSPAFNKTEPYWL